MGLGNNFNSVVQNIGGGGGGGEVYPIKSIK